MDELHIELGAIREQLSKQGMLRRASAASFAQDAGRRPVGVASVRNRPQTLDDLAKRFGSRALRLRIEP
jgi:hypothetical protein